MGRKESNKQTKQTNTGTDTPREEIGTPNRISGSAHDAKKTP